MMNNRNYNKFIRDKEALMGYIHVDSTVFDKLRFQFSRRYGNSAKRLAVALDQHFPDDERRGIKHLISVRTLQNFFDIENESKTNEVYLNYLCQHLLEAEGGYQEALVVNNRSASLMNPVSGDVAIVPLDQDHIEELVFLQSQNTRRKCSDMKILTMDEPVKIESIFTELNVLKRGHKQKIIRSVLSEGSEQEADVYNLGFLISKKGVLVETVLVDNPRLTIWGRLGAGKSTLMKHLALSPLFDDRKVVFLQLKSLPKIDGEFSILRNIFEDFCTENEAQEAWVLQLAQQGQLVLLLDGLDEVKKEDFDAVCQTIEAFVDRYPSNRYVVTCRYGVYNYGFRSFTEVEIAGFSETGIYEFVAKWFDRIGDGERGREFIQTLKTDASAKSLAANPLQLNLLCLMVQRGYGIPENRFALYEEAIEVLLEKWDKYRFILRDATKLTKNKKIDFLGTLAYKGFSKESKAFIWNTWQLEESVREILTRSSQYDIDTIEDDCREEVQAIQSHHGILEEVGQREYAFSNPGFQEYFTATHIVRQRRTELLISVVEQHLTDRRWESIFLLIAEKLYAADEFLLQMFKVANRLVQRPALQRWLQWLDHITQVCNVATSSWRAGCLAIDTEIDFYLSRFAVTDELRCSVHILANLLQQYNQLRKETLRSTDAYEVRIKLACIHALAEDLANRGMNAQEVSLQKPTEFAQSYLPEYSDSIDRQLEQTIELARKLEHAELKKGLVELQHKLPSTDAVSNTWHAWAEHLDELILAHLDIGHDVVLELEDLANLKDYIYVCTLIVQCLQQVDASIAPQLRKSIRASFLLPMHKLLETFPEAVEKTQMLPAMTS